MKTCVPRVLTRPGIALCAALIVLALRSTVFAQGTAFTYQGRLNDGVNPATGIYDLRFTICDALADGSVVAGPATNTAVGVTNGLFTVALDFGAGVFTGAARWLEIAARTNGATSFTPLTPRQPLTPTPYAIMANAASNLSGVLPAAQLSGTVGNNQLANSSVIVNAGAGLSGGGAVALGGSTTLANAGVLSVTGNSDITASPTTGNVALGTTATSANTAGAIVKRDTSGNFSAGSITLAGALNLPATTATEGIVYSGGNPILHVYGSGNTFAGPNAGNQTMSGFANTAVGNYALRNNTSGTENTANGNGALRNNTNGNGNTATGAQALNNNRNGFYNTANGGYALYVNTSGSENTAVGDSALSYNTNGGANTAIGASALFNNSSGSNNIALGYQAGYNLTTGSSNIDIGHPGVATDTNIIRIGSGQSQTFIAGVLTGNGGGLTNIPATALVAPPPGMALIPAGAFTMGDTLDGLGYASPTNVTVSACYMDVNLVSLSQWKSVYYWATNHGYGFGYAGAGKAANHPVQTVKWYDTVKWSNARSQQAGLTPVYYTDAGLTQVYTNGEVTVYANWAAKGYRLPTEAEWEKAARGGLSGQRFPWGNVIDQTLANYYGNTGSYSYDLGPNGYNAAFTNGATPYTSPAGYFAANGYGLYDMAGNVFEWCWDWSGVPYGQPTTNNPTGPAGPLTYRVLRGGAWVSLASYSRCANRYSDSPSSAYNNYGFRCVRGL